MIFAIPEDEATDQQILRALAQSVSLRSDPIFDL